MQSHLSTEALSRGPGKLREIVTKFAGIEDVIGMHGGLPPASVFPITGLSITLTDGTTVPITDKAAVCAAQQYNLDPHGYLPLCSWARAHTASKHKPARTDLDVIMTNGASHAIEMILRTLLNRGESILVEEFSFSHVLENYIMPQGITPLPVAMDAEGLCPTALDHAAELVPKSRRVLYVVPTAQNPTGAVMSLERKRQIYAICQKHDIVVIEDDPYAYLQFPPGQDLPGTTIEPGFLHFDVDGRVIRVDSCAKAVAPGLRLGWVTCGPELATPLIRAIQSSTMGPSGPSQVILHSILSHWGDAGFEKFIRDMQSTYREKAEALHEALLEHVGSLAEWSRPKAGMFLWLKILGIQDAGELMEELVAHKVVVLPGKAFHVRMDDPDVKCTYFRLAFSYMTPEMLREGAKRLGDVLKAMHASAETPAVALAN